MSDKTITVPWSGGLDSTYLILKALAEGHKVQAISFDGRNLPNSNHEAGARSRIKHIIQHSKYNNKFNHTEIQIPGIGGMWPNAYMWAQHTVWMRMLPIVVPYSDEVWMGYLASDGILEYIEEHMFNEYNSANYNIREDCSVPLPLLKIPLRKLTKNELWDKLTTGAEDLDLYGIIHEVSYCPYTWRIGDILFRCGGCEQCEKMDERGLTDIQPSQISDDSISPTIVDRILNSARESKWVRIKGDNKWWNYIRIKLRKSDGGDIHAGNIPHYKRMDIDIHQRYATLFIGHDIGPLSSSPWEVFDDCDELINDDFRINVNAFKVPDTIDHASYWDYVGSIQSLDFLTESE